MANENWCAVCGWSLAIGDDPIGCSRGNCSRRPLPQYFTDPDRAIAEGYDPELVERHRRPPPPPCPECERLKDHAAALYRALLEAATLADAHNGDESPSDIPESGKTWTSTAGRLIRENAAALKAMADTVRPAVIDRLTKERDAALATAQARDEEAGRLRERLVDARWFVERCAQSTDPYLSGVGKDGLARISAALGSPR